MQYLKISNHTEIEENAFKLLGACTKRGDSSKIGYFGSGLKYAIAVLLRENIGLKVFSGKKEIHIGLESQMFREQAFNVITICGEKTSLTTSMAVDWKTWQAIREILCNALDEEKPSHALVEKIEPEDGITSFYIPLENKDTQDIIDNWDKYFAQNRTAIAGDCCKIYESNNDIVNVYRKGIRCWDEPYESLYDYDFNKLDITESRTVKYTFQVTEGIAKLWGKYATPQMIKNLVSLEKKRGEGTYLEEEADWSYADFTEVWVKYFEGKILIPRLFSGWFPDLTSKPNAIILRDKLVHRLKKQFGDRICTATEEMDRRGQFCTTTPDRRQSFLLKECMQFLEEVKLTIPYDIKIGIFQDKMVFGTMRDKSIILSTTVFNAGKKQIVTTIIEECAHLESQQADESRGFQSYLINQIVTLLENQHGIFL